MSTGKEKRVPPEWKRQCVAFVIFFIPVHFNQLAELLASETAENQCISSEIVAVYSENVKGRIANRVPAHVTRPMQVFHFRSCACVCVCEFQSEKSRRQIHSERQ